MSDGSADASANAAVANLTEAQRLETEIIKMSGRLAALRRQETPVEVRDYAFQTTMGETRLSNLFDGRRRLLVIHNMGQACRYCTVYADGINGVLQHLEDVMSVALVSKDPPKTQRKLALDRGWRFRTASHGGGDYVREQCAMAGYENCPGAAAYALNDGKIFRTSQTAFCPGDLYSPVWPFLSLAGLGATSDKDGADEWTPQFHYWRRPRELEDGGANVRD